MANTYRNFFLLLFLLLCGLGLSAQELPLLRSFDTNQLPGKNQNWMITQDANGFMYVANSAGIMVFDGFRWSLIQLPNQSIVRSVFRGEDECIYAGGFQTFGFIDDGDPEALSYRPLSEDMPQEWIAQQEMWNIFELDSTIYWQSFSAIYGYKQDSIFRLIPPTNIMFAQDVDNTILIPSLDEGIFKLANKDIELIQDNSGLPEGARVAGIIRENNGESLIIGTQDDGIFYRKNKQYKPILLPINEMVIKDRLNRIIRLSDGSIALGTIRNGLYILNEKLEIKFHLNKSNGLPNNTVLSLFEDKDNNLWVGMDKGICLLELDSPKKYYYDKAGLLGSIYAAIDYDSTRYIGTNQGLFFLNEDLEYELIPKTQGQVWSLLRYEKTLLCAHNSGTFVVNKNKSRQITRNTGVWDMSMTNNGKIIQSTYTGLTALTFKYSNELESLRFEDEPFLIQKFILEGQKLVGIHPQQGVYIVNFNASFTEIESALFLDQKQLPNVKLTDIKLIDGKVYFRSDSGFYELNAEYNTVIESQLELHEWLDINPSINLEDELSNISAVPIVDVNSKNILPYIFQGSDGYFTFNNSVSSQEPIEILVNGLSSKSKVIQNYMSIPSYNNDITIKLVNNLPSLQGELSSEYKVVGYDSNWKSIPSNGIIQARNLNRGEYQLLVRNMQNEKDEKQLLEFRILAPWYSSTLAIVIYTVLGLAVILLLYNQQKKRLNRIELKLKEEQEEKLLNAKMKARNEQLEQEIKYKSKMLANNAMTLIQKNKMLTDLKDYLKRARNEENAIEYEKLVKLINRNIKSDEDWEIFERNFAEVHEDFITSLRKKHISLTAGELRLAAYIRMNLSSKEIAPLLNISVRSVENKRHRLRKKIEIPNSLPLKEYLMRF